jgi:hypothetical protein
VSSRPVSLFDKTPECISGFKTFRVDPILPQGRSDGPDSITRAIGCLCGNESLYLEAAQHKELRGVCSKSEIIKFKPPVYVVCPSCSKTALLFDPSIHGWRAEQGLWRGVENRFTLVKCAAQPGRIWVNHTYNNIAGYEELLRNGVVNIEDYFESFSAFQENASGDNFLEIVSFRCA